MPLRLVAACAVLSTAVWGLRVQAAVQQRPPPPTVIWYAPFLSGGGYCSEANSYVEAIDWAIRARRDHDARELQKKKEHEAVETEFDSAADGSDDADNGGSLHDERPFGLYITQHGDSYNAAFIRDLPDPMRELLNEVRRVTARHRQSLLCIDTVRMWPTNSTGSKSATSTGA
jgi:hypothetical protein